jgi:hypothetical protein
MSFLEELVITFTCSFRSLLQVDDKQVDLPHWVLSAMKCLANWPKQLRTANGKESGLPNYAGFENDVFNVVKDYFLGLPGPLTTYPLYEFLVDAFIKAEAFSCPPSSGRPLLSVLPCSAPRAGGVTATNLETRVGGQLGEEELPGQLTSQQRADRIRETFQVWIQCCGSGMFYPGSGSDHCSIPDPDPGSGG